MIILVVVISLITKRCMSEPEPILPTDKIELEIDSVTKVNDSIKIKVEILDSIKNAEIIEISSLDNDSTVKLFFKLVRE